MHKHEKEKSIDSESSVIIHREHTNKDTKAKDTTDPGLRGIILTRNELHTYVGEFGAICPKVSNFNYIECLILDFNFVYIKKKGYYAPIATELVNSLKQMKTIQTSSIRGNYDHSSKINSKTLYLLEHEDLIPLFRYINNGTDNKNKQTHSKKYILQVLYLDGNHLSAKMCEMLGQNKKFNSKLEILSCENCKISLEGLKLLLACATGVDPSIYDTLPFQTLDICCKNLEKIEAICKANKIRHETEARERRKTIEQDDKNDEAKTQAVKDNHVASADKDLVATSDDDDESSSTDDLLDGYATAGVGGDESPMLARLLQNNSGGLPISMGARPSGVIKPFQFNSSWYQLQKNVSGMTNFNGESIGNTARMLISNGMWNNKLLVVASDSGGPSGTDGDAANNCPLRGGKYSDFQGGIRAVSLVFGGFVSPNRRGMKLNGTMHSADWYSTFCNIIGNNPNETRSNASNKYNKENNISSPTYIPQIASINMLNFIISKLVHILFVLVLLMVICQTDVVSPKQNLLEFKFKHANVDYGKCFNGIIVSNK